MRTSSLMTVLLVAAALAGCTGGSSNEGQLPEETADGTSSVTQSRSQTRGPGANEGRGDDKTYDAYLEISPDNGTAPLNVTITFGATWQDNGQRAGQDGKNGTAANGTAGNGNGGNGTGRGNGGGSANGTSSGPASNGTGNGTGGSGGSAGADGNGTRNDGSHPVNGGHDVTWTLEVRLAGGSASGDGNGANGTGTSSGNATGNQTGGNTTSSNSTSSSQTSTGTGSGNETGNGTSSTNTTTGSPDDGNGTGDGSTGNGTVVASFNGTGDDLPGNETVLLNETGSYTVTFTVTTEDGQVLVRNASIAVEPLPPGSPLGNETTTFEGSALVAAPALCGSEEFTWVLNGTFAGHAAEVSHVNLTMETSGFGDWEMTLVAPNGTELGAGTEIHAEGPFEAGNYTLTVENCMDVESSFTVTATAHYATRSV